MTPVAVEGRVAVVVLNWESGELGARAVGSALALDWPDVEVVVVDNASADDSMGEIERRFGDRVRAVRNEANVGFALGMAAGFEATSGEFVVSLNCDAALDPGFARALVGALRRHPDAAAAGGTVRSERIGDTGPIEITATMRTRRGPTAAARACDKVDGACTMFRRSALEHLVQVGVRDRLAPYDVGYAMYGEDVDVALTLARLGWTYRFEPSAGATHVRSFASAPRLADRRGALRTSTLANRHRNIVRHARRWPVLDVVATAQDAGFAALALARGDRSAPLDVVRAWRVHARTLRADLARRSALGPRRPALLTTGGPWV